MNEHESRVYSDVRSVNFPLFYRICDDEINYESQDEGGKLLADSIEH